jgi:hypothetical protein
MNGQIRQGDILLVPVETAIPVDAVRSTEVVLAMGETTGHAHRLAAPEVLEWKANGQRYVRVIGPAPGTLAHEDHDPIPAPVVAPEVTYLVVPQHEWDLRGQWKKVKD